MAATDDLREEVESFGVEEIGLSKGGEPVESLGELEKNLQKATFYVKPDIKGVMNVSYDWPNNTTPIMTYNNTLIFRAREISNKSLNHQEKGEWQSLGYQIGREEAENLERALRQQFREVKVDTFPETVIPPEIKERIR